MKVSYLACDLCQNRLDKPEPYIVLKLEGRRSDTHTIGLMLDETIFKGRNTIQRDIGRFDVCADCGHKIGVKAFNSNVQPTRPLPQREF